ncbi:MAG: hypothetical protein KBC21_04425 [Candidatus Pacebacteria bacterium]|nr:hypothetical protein [Candidatus Paceibacterota bacterium]
MKVIDPGHIYECDQLGGGTQILTFVKRSSGAVTYENEWAGMQTQEVLRALIDRTKFLNTVLPCKETPKALKHLQLALYWYEVRAHRRKKENVNCTELQHRECEDLSVDVPFTDTDIEYRKVGSDGHIII